MSIPNNMIPNTNTEKPYLVVAFYQFVTITDTELLQLQAELKTICKQYEIFGTILLAEEGMNGTVASIEEGIHALVNFFSEHSSFAHMEYKYSETMLMPFQKTKVVIKKEIVTLGIDHINPNKKTGIYVEPKDWNTLISEENVLLIDTRNDFEVELGTFQGATNPKTEKFSDFPAFVENLKNELSNALAHDKPKKIAMFCTGGIRCEKASAYLLEQGFAEVYQLEGGILKYLEKIPKENSLWQGECFIFDRRRILEKDSIKAKETY